MACVPAAESKTSFDIEESPTWRKSDVTTSTMMKDITNWRKKYTNFSKDDERFLKIFVKSMAVDYLCLNQDELVGTQTKEEFEEVIQMILDKIRPPDPPQAEKETVNTHRANDPPQAEKETVNTHRANDPPQAEKETVNTHKANDPPQAEKETVNAHKANDPPQAEKETVNTHNANDPPQAEKETVNTHKANDPPQAEKETVNTLKAMKNLFELKNEMKGTGLLTVDQINAVHKVLLEGLHSCCGTIRKTKAYTTWKGIKHDYPDPERVEGLLYALIDHHNISMESLPKEKDSLEYTTKVFKCAARLLFDFVDTHPYGDGNGQMCRLLANHITGLITPFPVSLYHKRDDRSDRNDYIKAIVRCRDNPSEGPRELAAMLVEGAWHGWKTLLQNIESQPKTSVVVRNSY